MNDFNKAMSALYEYASGCEITGYHNGKPFAGQIEQIRVRYGGDLAVYVKKDDGETIAVSGKAIVEGKNNLHVYY